MAVVRLYHVWKLMLRRCHTPSDSRYPWYGARGISVCDEWRDDFTSFCGWALSNGYAGGLQLDRMNVNGHYDPDNCRFTDRSTNMQNTRRAISVTAFGKSQPLKVWADETGIPYGRLHTRISRGWKPELALTAGAYETKRKALK